MPATNPGTANLISWWELNENGGTAYDAHGTNHLTETSGTIPLAAGGVGRDFEAGESEYLEIASNASLQFADEDFFICFRANIESVSASYYRYVLTKYYTTPNKREYGFRILNGTTKFTFFVSSDGTSANTTFVTLADNIGTATWATIMGWHSASENKIYISVNNGEAVEAAHAGGCFSSDAAFRIGNAVLGAEYSYDGIIHSPIMYRMIPTADERTWIYNDNNGRSYAEVAGLDTVNQINWW